MLKLTSRGSRASSPHPPTGIPQSTLTRSKHAASGEDVIPHESRTINILIAIDTDGVQTKYSNPSQDPANPTTISNTYGYMVCTGTQVTSGQGTGNIYFNASVGDTIRAFATSGSDNFEDSVLLYGLPRYSGDQVMHNFNYEEYTKSTVLPHSDESPLPADTSKTEDFWFYEASVAKKGSEKYWVQFAIYTRDDNDNPQLVGYYQWEPTINVAG